MTRPLTVGGLFSGIGGWELGLERAGMEIAWHCEADPFCRRVLEKHWPRVPTFDDVCTLNAGMAEGVDVLCGGFPCQDISIAGKGAGIEGARSGLWAEYARLIGEFRPRYVLVENVSALLGRGLDRVLGDLAALGYDAEWDCIPASAVGAPHQRDRIWLVAYPKRVELREQPNGLSRREGAPIPRNDGTDGTPADSERVNGGQGRSRGSDPSAQGERKSIGSFHLADASGEGSEGWFGAQASREALGLSATNYGREWAQGPTVPGVCRVGYGLPDWVDRIRSLGNALVPQISEWIGRRIVEYEALSTS